MAMRWLASLAVCLVTSACMHAHPGAQLPSSLRQQILRDADRAAHANRTNAVRVEVVRTTFVEASRFKESAQPEPLDWCGLLSGTRRRARFARPATGMATGTRSGWARWNGPTPSRVRRSAIPAFWPDIRI
jgi:hypothetical protein